MCEQESLFYSRLRCSELQQLLLPSPASGIEKNRKKTMTRNEANCECDSSTLHRLQFGCWSQHQHQHREEQNRSEGGKREKRGQKLIAQLYSFCLCLSFFSCSEKKFCYHTWRSRYTRRTEHRTRVVLKKQKKKKRRISSETFTDNSTLFTQMIF